MISCQSGQVGVTLPARDCPFYYGNKILPKSKRVHESFLSQSILRESKKIFCDFSVGIELESEKTKSVNENENKENKDVENGKHKSKNTKRQEGVESHIKYNPLLTKLVRSR